MFLGRRLQSQRESKLGRDAHNFHEGPQQDRPRTQEDQPLMGQQRFTPFPRSKKDTDSSVATRCLQRVSARYVNFFSSAFLLGAHAGFSFGSAFG